MGRCVTALIAAVLLAAVPGCSGETGGEAPAPVISLARIGATAPMTLCLELDFNHGRIWK
jgi:hypothetical protein